MVDQFHALSLLRYELSNKKETKMQNYHKKRKETTPFKELQSLLIYMLPLPSKLITNTSKCHHRAHDTPVHLHTLV